MMEACGLKLNITRSFGDYGANKQDDQPILHAQLSCEETGQEHVIPKRLILVVDTSYSMDSVFPMLQATLLAVWNFCEKQKQQELYVVTFDQDARIVWSPDHVKSGATFTDMVKQMRTGPSTNLEAGLEVGYKLRGDLVLNHIYVLTDGQPNVGNSSTEYFRKFTESKANWWTFVAAIGYGDDYNVEILRQIGQFSHVRNDEAIPATIGQFMGQLISTRYVSCGLQAVAKRSPIVGDAWTLPNFPAGSKYNWIWIGPFEEKTLTVVYADLVAKKMGYFTVPVPSLADAAVPPSLEVRQHFYSTVAGILSRKLAETHFAQEVVDETSLQIKAWESDTTRHRLALPLMVQLRNLLRQQSVRITRDYSSSCSRQSSNGTTCTATPYAVTQTCAAMGNLVLESASSSMRTSSAN